MSSSEFVRTAKRLIRENPDIYEALLEFERTRKMPRLKRKKRANFTIDADLLREFRKLSAKRGVKMSARNCGRMAER